MSINDNNSQDSVSNDSSFCITNADKEVESSNTSNDLMMDITKESPQPVLTPNFDATIEANNDGGCYIFNNVFYLGSSVLQRSNDALEINSCISHFSKQNNKLNYKVSLSIPFLNIGYVRIIDQENAALLGEYSISKVGFCTGGFKGEFDDYFVFTYLQTDDNNNEQPSDDNGFRVFQCFVFKMKSPYYSDRILECFHRTFNGRFNNIINQPSTVRSYTRTVVVQLNLTLDIKEDDGKGSFVSVPKEDNQIFKLKSNTKKKIVIKLDQVDGPLHFYIEKCLGLFIGAGRYLNERDLTPLNMDSSGEIGHNGDGFIISGEWNPGDVGFELLNCTRDKDQQVYMTIGISFRMEEVAVPICLNIACKTKIYPESQRFWPTLKKPTIIHLRISLEEMSDCVLNRVFVDIYSTKTVQYIWPDNIITVICNTSRDAANVEQLSDSDNEESIEGSSGLVSNEELIARWKLFLTGWACDLQARPKELLKLVKSGIPDSLRGEVWPLLTSSVNKERELLETYKVLITKETQFDSIIKRDMSRIFTAHQKFAPSTVSSQEVLFQVCKAYALYDEEIGYCQSVALLAATLLNHMSEEQSFGLLVTIMYDYKVREMYRNNFEGLHICLYQLDNLMGEELNDLYMHLSELQLESHLYANQWFMTLFTMKFPLGTVWHILDLFFTEGIVIVFKIALAVLKLSRKELLTMDFQGALTHFRVALPTLYCTEESCKHLIRVALKINISDSKLLRLEDEWRKIQLVKAENEDPLAMVQTELKRTKEEYNRLDQESDCLAKELLSTKVCLQRTVEKLEDNLDVTNKDLFTTRKEFVDIVDEKEHLQAELREVKDKFREEVQMYEGKLRENDSTVVEYEKSVAQLNERIKNAEYRTVEESDSRASEYLESIISKCEHYKKHVNDTQLLLDGYNHSGKMDDILCLTRGHYYHHRDQMHQTELSLVNQKLLLVESQCAQQKLSNEITYLKNLVNKQSQSLDSSKASIIQKLWNYGTKLTEEKSELVVKWSQDSSTSLSHFVQDA